jgi:hypothetical protein
VRAVEDTSPKKTPAHSRKASITVFDDLNKDAWDDEVTVAYIASHLEGLAPTTPKRTTPQQQTPSSPMRSSDSNPLVAQLAG